MPAKNPSSAHLHAHLAGDAKHAHFFENRSQKILAWALGLTLAFAVVEVLAGFLSHSLALISDAGHMVTDAAALGLALLAQVIAKRPPSAKHSFGFGRAEALAAFVNGLAMLAVVLWIAYEAVQRFAAPQPVQGGMVVVVAAIGLAINLVVAWVLSKDKDSLNTRAALVHVMGDLLGSLAALAAGAVIYLTGWMRIDPLLSIFVSLLILKSTVGVLRESYHFLMEGVPRQIDYLAVGADLAQVDGVLSVHDLHVWDMSPGQPALIGHLEIADLREWPRVLRAVKAMLLERHNIDHVTLQAEAAGMGDLHAAEHTH
ncbi:MULTISPECIES: cation diffusion facilitator family transporter [unclassified Janthinobacterium]|uniref:cation diffusion facilitator family transporter n=1 Tax=unclassified Janthinobacterium TaxID=2610881 RepID=UPI00034D1C38|nr:MULTISPECIES: cation diffusion facilitator family transporter [unclassified Janthinobacterium]MEC5163889.1 cobalt-zinc-cadmium efflux system protein [Janthinobacterium sp. CG_S6]